MTRLFKIERIHRKLISKPTLLNVLTHLDKGLLETPALLLDRSRLRERALAVGRGIGNSRVFYAIKANPEPEVIKFLDTLGLGFEIASEGELSMLMDIGIAPERIITSNPVKTLKFLDMAQKYGLGYFAFDSRDEVRKLSEAVPGRGVYVRLSVPNEGSEWPLSRKFGVELDEALALVLLAKEQGLDPVGITFHVGSQCTNISNWDTALYKARRLWDMAKGKGIEFRMLNIGGGYPIKYTKEVVGIEAIDKNVGRLIAEKFPAGTEVFIEPGRAVVGDAGVFAATVIGKALRPDGNWLYLDVGVFNGMMEALGGIRYTYIVEASGGARKKHWTITGPSCDSFDVMDNNVALPEPDIGALVLILSAGAYTVSYASEFNGFSIPKTVLI